MNYQNVHSNRNQFISLTTLYPEEFDLLLPFFAVLWYSFYRTHTLEGKRRKKVFWHNQKDTPTLPSVEEKLFFLLVYYKQHPLQQFAAATFGLSQAKVSLWVKILTPLLEQALKKLGCLPCRDGSALNRFLADFDNADIINQDVVEQTMPRPVADDAQKEMYSGKKKDHTYKNKVDCGFQGYAPEGIHIVMPFKKPRNGFLKPIQIWFNQYVGQRRIVVEHAIRGIKRFHIIQHACRLAGYWVRDQIMNICTAIHNLRVRSPLRKYDSNQKFQLSCV